MCWQMLLPYVEDVEPHLMFCFFFVYILADVVAMVADGMTTQGE